MDQLVRLWQPDLVVPVALVHAHLAAGVQIREVAPARTGRHLGCWTQDDDMAAEPRSDGPADVDDVDALLDIGEALSEAGDEAQAEAYFRAAAGLGSRAGWFDLGEALSRQGRPGEAAPAYLHAAAAGADEALLNAGLAYLDLGDWPAAEAAYRQAMADPDGRLCLGDLWRWHGDPAAAEAVWQEAADEGDALCAGALGSWLLQRDRAAEAEPLLRQAVDVDDDARSDLAHLLRGRGELDEAELLLRAGSANGHPDSMIELALLLEEDRGDLREAEAVFRSAIAGGELHAHNDLGLLLRERGDLVEAQQEFRTGARGGDALAARNLADLQSTHRRQLNRAHRRRTRARGTDELADALADDERQASGGRDGGAA